MERAIDKELLKWKDEKKRKVLLVRGARQVGKTYSLRQLGQHFKYFAEVNFEEHPEISTFFERSLNPGPICEKLAIYLGTPIIPGETLLFFDEIQACADAIKSLRFFYERMPELHVAAAGSLLEFALEEIPSFGVGRLRNVFMYPMTFNEYLDALGEQNLKQLIARSSSANPVDPVIHDKILDRLKIFQIIGGMPEVVRTYIEERNLPKCQIVIDNILTTIIDDFAKYRRRVPVSRLQEVFNSIVHQSGGKFKYTNVANGNTRPYKEALELLIKAGQTYKVCHTAARGVPLGGQIDEKRFKVLLFDTGVYQRVLGLDLSNYIVSDFGDLINKGNLSELFVGLELIAAGSPHLHPGLYYWHREARSSNAEIDYVVSGKGKIIPIEVKAGTRGQMQSLHIFLRERNLNRGIRLSHQNFSDYDKISTIPVYAASQIYNLF